MNSVCVICFENKPLNEFNREHVFPETIGGRLCVHTVCKSCNGELGKNIDNAFLNHITIAYFRNVHGLNREKNRGIKNPLKHYNQPDDDFYFEFRNGQITKHLKPKKKVVMVHGVSRVEYSMDEVDFTEGKTANLIQKVANDFGVKKEEIEFRVDKNYYPSEQRLFLAPNNPLIMEAAKIAHELASEHVPDYVSTEVSKIYGQALKNGVMSKQFVVMASNPLLWVTISMSRVHWGKAVGGHFVLISGVEGVGLVAVVKFFNTALSYPLTQLLILSLEQTFMHIKPTLIVNDFIEKKVEYLNQDISISGGFRFPKSD